MLPERFWRHKKKLVKCTNQIYSSYYIHCTQIMFTINTNANAFNRILHKSCCFNWHLGVVNQTIATASGVMLYKSLVVGAAISYVWWRGKGEPLTVRTSINPDASRHQPDPLYSKYKCDIPKHFRTAGLLIGLWCAYTSSFQVYIYIFAYSHVIYSGRSSIQICIYKYPYSQPSQKARI